MDDHHRDEHHGRAAVDVDRREQRGEVGIDEPADGRPCRVGDEQARVAAGEAVVWPPNVVHSAWTELTPMRAIIVEFATRPAEPLELDSGVTDSPADAPEEPAEEPAAHPPRVDDGLVSKPAVLPPDRESPDQEPW